MENRAITPEPLEYDIIIHFRKMMLRVILIVIALFGTVLPLYSIFVTQFMPVELMVLDFIFAIVAATLCVLNIRQKVSYNTILYTTTFLAFAVFTGAFVMQSDDSYRGAWFIALVVLAFMLHTLRTAVWIAIASMVIIIASFMALDMAIGINSVVTLVSVMIVVATTTYFYNKKLNFYETLLVEQNRKLDTLATHDSLTGMPNRRHFLEMGHKYLHHAKRNNFELCFTLLDIDNFKTINDTYGHAAGDEVLRRVKHVFESSLREGDIYGRLGGEEFGVILMVHTLNAAERVAQKLLEQLRAQTFDFKDTPLSVTASIGIASSKGFTHINNLMEHADKKMYEAKEQGKNRICC